MTPQEFIQKWSAIRINELAIAQAHFFDVCALVEHPIPYSGTIPVDEFRFEAPTINPDGRKGRADAFYKGKFVWEYKGAHANLDKAYQQVLRYREALGNPPLLIVSDTQRILIHTNYTNTISETHEITLDNLMHPDNQRKLKLCFAHPDEIEAFYKPTRTQAIVTEANAKTFVKMADELKAYSELDKVTTTPEQLARFIVRILFCLFAEDMNLLPAQVFSKMVTYWSDDSSWLEPSFRGLFKTMHAGGLYGYFKLPYFNGDLFDGDFVPSLPGGIGKQLLESARQDWSGVDPVIFGTLFERIIDPAKRAQLGAHYTSKEDILLIIEPVLMQPLQREWDSVRRKVDRALRKGNHDSATVQLRNFATRISEVKVLDPACGSGNFLYVALRRLLDLQKEVLVHAERNGLASPPLTVSPAQLYGIEINPYAHELAQITIWIGYLQWRKENGYADFQEPILQPLNQIERKDAILAYDADGNPVEPEWPSADVIIGNPPFLGGNKIRQELGDQLVDTYFKLFDGKVPAFADLVCYWFYLANIQIQQGKASRAGLIATQGIRGGVNRRVLEKIKQSGDIFYAHSDRNWMLDGAMVHVSIVGFDNGTETRRSLNGLTVSKINSDLTTSIDTTIAMPLVENDGICFMGPSPKGKFDIPNSLAISMLDGSNADGKTNHKVIRPVVSATDLVNTPRHKWTIDFGMMREEEAATYHLPYQYVKEYVYPSRSKNRRKAYADRWWQYAEARPGMRRALAGLDRFIATPSVSKHRIFVWLEPNILSNQGTLVFASDSDYVFGILQSKVHEQWARAKGTQLREAESGFRYTPTSTFDTFPFPWSPKSEPDEDERVAMIVEASQELVSFRQAWINPSVGQLGIYFSESDLKRRTLTNMYNALQHFRAAKAENRLHTLEFRDGWKTTVKSDFTIAQAQELDDLHSELDEAVLDVYGWAHDLTDEQILERLLALNLERAAQSAE